MPQDPLENASGHQALRLAAVAVDGAERRAQPFEMTQLLTVLARRYLAVGQLAGAEVCLQAALRWAGVAGAGDQSVDLLCELCELAAHEADVALAEQPERPGRIRAARERARDHAIAAAALAGRVADPGWEVKVLLRISDVLDRCGDRHQAALLQTRALRLISGHCTGSDWAVLPGLGRLADI